VVFVLGQAGVSANLQIPDGLTAEDLETAEDMVLEWKEDGHYRAIDLVVTVYKYLLGVAHARQKELCSTSEAQYSDGQPSAPPP
jgi:hypothetical protein